MRGIKILIFSLLSVQSFSQIIATTALKNIVGDVYYIAQGGTGDGKTPSTPMDDSDLLSTTLGYNDYVYLNRGDELLIGNFDVNNPVTVSAYGSGPDPIITTASDISGLTWIDEGGGIYSATMAEEPNWVWINGECAKMAETARIPVLSRGSATTATITHSLVSGYTSIVGSYLVMKQTRFRQSFRRTITNYDGAGLITFDDDIPIGTQPAEDLVILNNTEYFNGDNEWAWESGTLYVKAAASPSTLDIRATTYEYSIKVSESFAIDNVEFKEAYSAAIWSTGFNPVTVTECTFHDIRDMAILLQRQTTGSNISSNTFLRIGNNGIFTRPAIDLMVNNNMFSKMGMQSNYYWQTWNDDASLKSAPAGGCAIRMASDFLFSSVDGNNCTFQFNTIDSTAYSSICLDIGTENLITKNKISNHVKRFDDGGAIYIFHARNQNVPHENTEISYNIIEGESSILTDLKVGIYCDNRSRATFVHHNTVQNCYYGIFVNYDTENTIVEDNVLYRNIYGIVFQTANPTGFLYPTNINNQNNRNVIASVGSGQRSMFFGVFSYIDPTWNPYSGTGGADNNVYIKNAAPNANDIADSDNKGIDLTLSELQTAYGEDASSVKLTRNPVLFINETDAISNEDAQGDYRDFSDVPVTTYTINPYYSRVLNEIPYSNFFTASSSQYFNAGTTPDIQFTHTDVFSVSIRFKMSANPSATQTLLDNRDASNRGISFNVLTTGGVQVQLINTTATNRITFVVNTDFADNSWHQLFFVKKASAASSVLYVDGVLQSPTINNNLSATTASTQDWNIGRTSGLALQYYDGFIDDVAIWNTDQQANVVQIYNGGRSIDYRLNLSAANRPLHYWRLGESPSLIDGYQDIGMSATLLNLTNVNGVTSSSDSP